jgi:hypothetical protein
MPLRDALPHRAVVAVSSIDCANVGDRDAVSGSIEDVQRLAGVPGDVVLMHVPRGFGNDMAIAIADDLGLGRDVGTVQHANTPPVEDDRLQQF